MKIGPLNVTLAAKPHAAPLGETGATGTQIFGGLLLEHEYNTKLGSPQLYTEFDKMRNDGQVRAGLTAIKLPLLNADWHVEPPTDKPLDREIADRLNQRLMEGMNMPFRVTLRQALLMLDYGSMPMEKVWEISDGLVMLRKLPMRLPSTVIFWLVDDTGGLSGIRQGAWRGSGYEIVDIPVEKLIVFINDLEGSNWRGTSVLRAAYKHYFYKDGLYRVQAIALEKRSLGIDVGTLGGDAVTVERQRELEQALMTLHAHEKQFFTEVEGQVKYRLEGTGSQGLLDPSGAIEHHDLRILRSILAEFLNMGAGSTGSLAMHKDKSAFFLMALGGHANNVADTFTRHLVQPWVDYNWSVDQYPRLTYSRLESRDLEQFADSVLKLTTAGVLTPDAGLEREARSLLDVPAQLAGEPPRDTTTPVPTLIRQVEKLVEVGRAVFERADVGRAADVSVPWRVQLTDELEEQMGDRDQAAAVAAIAMSGMKAAFVGEIVRQIKEGEFKQARLRSALLAGGLARMRGRSE